MRDRLLVFLLFGIGMLKLYEEFDDEEQEEGGSPDILKHKHSRRDVNSQQKQRLPEPISEEVMEAVHSEGWHSDFAKCKTVIDDCSCSRLLCFGPSSCSVTLPDVLIKKVKIVANNVTNQPVWMKRCRQTTMLGQNLCECRRCSYHRDDYELVKKLESLAEDFVFASSHF